MASEAQVAANRANAAKSTGPRTADGKAKVAQNGLKHGLCAKEAVLPYEDREEYDAMLAELAALWRPANRLELALVEEHAGCTWRLRRAMQMETGMLKANWPRKLQELHDENPGREPLGLSMETMGLGLAFQKASKEISRLSLHESRISRQRDRALAALELAQARRRAREAELALDSQTRDSSSPATAGEEGGPPRGDGKGEGQAATRTLPPSPAPLPGVHAAPLPPERKRELHQDLGPELALDSRMAA